MPTERQGFRLHRFEVLNWGTFDRLVWSIVPAGDNALLTGDIGSGKSTLVDALTTLLVPPQRIIYNRAAGAQGRERNLASYVRGHYKNEKEEGGVSAKAVALRDHTRHSVVLGLFHNEALGEWVTAAQVFWLKPGQSAPERHYFVADRPLSIAADFSGFGKDIPALKKRLRQAGGVEDFDAFTGYSAELRRRLGIDSEHALTLFYQTVSLKSVGNLTEFVREHMLDEPAVKERIDTLCLEFHHLNQAHEAVVRARRQVDMLKPLVESCDKLDALVAATKHLEGCRGALHAHFEAQRASLLVDRIARRRSDVARLDDRIRLLKEQLDALRSQSLDVQRAIDDQGGRRLADIDREVPALTAERTRRQAQAKRYDDLCHSLGLEKRAAGEASFHDSRAAAQGRKNSLEAEQQQLEARTVELGVERDGLIKAHAELESELESLRARKSNIEARMLGIRTRICGALGLEPDALPFAGELMRVRSDEHRWEGAIERVLRNFAQSLLVAERDYGAVAGFVDRTDLKGRLVYFRVADRLRSLARSPAPDSLVRKLELKPEGHLVAWLEHELAERFDYACCDDLDSFKRRPKALTVAGQVKSGHDKHEKDDRHRLDDRSRYVLGWSNEEKIRVLEEREAAMHRKMLGVVEAMQNIERDRRALTEQRDRLLELLRVERFSDIAWEPVAKQIQELLDEKKRIEESSDALRELQARLVRVTDEIEAADADLDSRRGERADAAAKLGNDEAALQAARLAVEALAAAEREGLFAALAAMQGEALAGREVTVEGCSAREQDMRGWLQSRIDAEVKRAGRLREDIVARMGEYKAAFAVEARDADARPEAAAEYRGMLDKLVSEDLPRHEARFKRMLNEGTINDVALLRSQLESERDAIERKLARINESLAAIEYQPGTYIELVRDLSTDAEIRQFQADLRACLGDTLAGGEDALYTEAKFQQVKALVDRFVGREGHTEIDRRWAHKVADVRNWFMFSASERWRHDGKEREHYSDSAGKSGGQKEKLAYTILASALVYQFGLERGSARPRSFRFVMIDEAFGRGSDDSARYALDLFATFDLQLLIVTPLQKIHVIEDYVRTVNFVHNDGGKQSMVRNLSIEEYRAEKAERHARHGIAVDNPG